MAGCHGETAGGSITIPESNSEELTPMIAPTAEIIEGDSHANKLPEMNQEPVVITPVVGKTGWGKAGGAPGALLAPPIGETTTTSNLASPAHNNGRTPTKSTSVNLSPGTLKGSPLLVKGYTRSAGPEAVKREAAATVEAGSEINDNSRVTLTLEASPSSNLIENLPEVSNKLKISVTFLVVEA